DPSNRVSRAGTQPGCTAPNADKPVTSWSAAVSSTASAPTSLPSGIAGAARTVTPPAGPVPAVSVTTTVSGAPDKGVTSTIGPVDGSGKTGAPRGSGMLKANTWSPPSDVTSTCIPDSSCNTANALGSEGMPVKGTKVLSSARPPSTGARSTT